MKCSALNFYWGIHRKLKSFKWGEIHTIPQNLLIRQTYKKLSNFRDKTRVQYRYNILIIFKNE